MKINNNILEIFNELDNHSIRHQVEFRPNEAAQIKDVSDLVKNINKIIPLMNYPGNNPNNGHTHHKFKVGRECGRVLYLNVVKAYMPKEFNWNHFFGALKELGRDFHADENELHENSSGSMTWRYWWD